MSGLWIVVILGLNFAISWWNAKVCGWLWHETKVMGLFMRLVLWCAAIQSVIGFSSVFMFGLVMVVAPMLDPPELGAEAIKFAFSLWYVMVIIPALGSGLVITLHSWIELFRTRSWVDLAATSWNTYAMVHNVSSAAESLGPAFDTVGEWLSYVFTFRGGDSSDGAKGALARLMLMIVVLALIGGALLTAVIIKRNMGRLPVPDVPSSGEADRLAARS